MASETAQHIARLVGLDGDEDVPDVVDNALAEVREVLEGLLERVKAQDQLLIAYRTGAHPKGTTFKALERTRETVQRTRALYEKLVIK
jgi:hypothetical protein